MTASTNPRVLRTNIGELSLDEYQLEADGRRFRLLHAGAILSHEDERRFLHAEGEARIPYGIVLWPAALALAHEILTRPVAGQRVLELGAGTGLPGIVAASLGARVVQTDRQEVSMCVCRRNAERNGVEIEHRIADFTAWNDDSEYDWIVGADILYASRMHAHLRRIFEKNLTPSGKVLLADPFREESFELLERMSESGWNIAVNKWTVGVQPPERPVAVFDLTRAT